MPIPYRQEVYRKLIHLSSTWMAAAMYFLPAGRAALLFLLLAAANVLVEYGYYKQWPVIHPLYKLFFGRMLRNSRGEGKFELSGGPYVPAAAFLAILCFKPPVAVCAFTVMLFGDTAAALIGRKFGRTKFANGKSLEGVLAFIAASALVLIVCGCIFTYPPSLYLKGGIGIVLAAAAELYEKKLHIDDNFSIPLLVGAAMSITW
ncbi:MAG: diacylglycerol/polyprenol kinase family protein [Victivallaceae bacterium]